MKQRRIITTIFATGILVSVGLPGADAQTKNTPIIFYQTTPITNTHTLLERALHGEGATPPITLHDQGWVGNGKASAKVPTIVTTQYIKGVTYPNKNTAKTYQTTAFSEIPSKNLTTIDPNQSYGAYDPTGQVYAESTFSYTVTTTSSGNYLAMQSVSGYWNANSVATNQYTLPYTQVEPFEIGTNANGGTSVNTHRQFCPATLSFSYGPSYFSAWPEIVWLSSDPGFAAFGVNTYAHVYNSATGQYVEWFELVNTLGPSTNPTQGESTTTHSPTYACP